MEEKYAFLALIWWWIGGVLQLLESEFHNIKEKTYILTQCSKKKKKEVKKDVMQEQHDGWNEEGEALIVTVNAAPKSTNTIESTSFVKCNLERQELFHFSFYICVFSEWNLQV